MSDPMDSLRKQAYDTVAIPATSADIAVVGGGMAGVFAAIAAGEAGVDTLLLEQHAFLGGQGTAGGVHTLCGETRVVNHLWSEMIARLEALDAIAEFRPTEGGRLFEIETMKFVLQEMLSLRKVRILLHTQLVDVICGEGAIESLVFFNKSGLQRMPCKQVIDASGDADVVARADLPFDKGGQVWRPGRDAPELVSGPSLQLPMSLYFSLVDTGKPVRPVLPDGCPRYESEDDIPMTTIKPVAGNLVTVKMKVIGHDATDGESLSLAEQEARKQMMGLVYYLQTHPSGRRDLSTYQLAWAAPHIGVREGRRVVGTYSLRDEDVFQGRRFDDAVAVGTYHLDYHWPGMAQRAGTGIKGMVPPYHIPLRSLRPEGAGNLLVPGRCVSGEHLAMSSFRVMGTCAATGHAAGVVAAMAIQMQKPIPALENSEVRKELVRTGVRFDKAPYESYLRSWRYFKEFVFEAPAKFAPSHHASSLIQLPDGDILCAWFAGTREGDKDVGIWIARRSDEVWSEPRQLIAPEGQACWNPVLFLPDGQRLTAECYKSGAARPEIDESGFPRVLLYYRTGTGVKDPIKLWKTWVIESNDGGETWSDPSPFSGGLLGPIKNKPVVLSNGEWFSGSSIERNEGDYCAMEISSDEGRTWMASPPIQDPEDPFALIQPTVWESTPGHLHALMRNRSIKKQRTPGKIWRVDSADYGRTWSKPYPTDLPSNDSGIDIAKMIPSPGDPGYNGKDHAPLALVWNPVETPKRSPLEIWISYDNGRTWPDRAAMEDEEGGQFAYPSIIPCAAGFLLSYTWKRESIVCSRFSLEHVTRASREKTPMPPMGDPLADVRSISL